MSRISGVFKHFIDRLLYSDIRGGSREELFHARLVTGVILVTMPCAAVLFLVDLLRGAYEYAGITFFFILLGFLSLWYVRRSGRYQLVGILLSSLPIVTLTRAALIEEGLASMYIPVLLILPAVAFLLGKRLGGLLHTGLTVAALTLIFVMSPDEGMLVSRYVILLVALFFCALSVLTFYNMNMSALRRVSSANRELEVSNEALETARREAEQALEFRNAFFASMSHEIRTPMNGVIGMTSLLYRTPLTEEQRDYIETIRVSGDSLLTIINDILDFSKIESGKLELETHPFSVTQCMEEVLDLLAFKAAEKDLELAYSADLPLGYRIVGDMTRLRQVIVNLVNNAIKFTERGSVTIEITEDGPAPALPGGATTISFRVKDTGIGIPADRLDRLFEPFQQVDASTTRRYGGTGLGLAICKRLCEAMGGGIEVFSVEGEGSVFQFSMYGAPAENETDYVSLTGQHFLLIDPRPFSRAMLKGALQKRGATVEAYAALVPEKLNPSADQIILDSTVANLKKPLALIEAWDVNVPVLLILPPGEVMPSNLKNERITTTNLPLKPDKIARLLHQKVSQSGGQETRSMDDLVAMYRQIALRILLVEDNVINQKVALRFLDRLGFVADVAGNGEEAIQAVHRQPYDLLLMDLQMPFMDGIAAAQMIRSNEKIEQPYIVGLTAEISAETWQTGREAGMDDFVAKPIRLEELSAAIELCVRTRGLSLPSF